MKRHVINSTILSNLLNFFILIYIILTASWSIVTYDVAKFYLFLNGVSWMKLIAYVQLCVLIRYWARIFLAMTLSTHVVLFKYQYLPIHCLGIYQIYRLVYMKLN